MSCYTRHLGDWLPPEPTWADRRVLDAAVRSELDLADADCPEVWAAVKARLAAGGTVPRGTLPSRTSASERVVQSTRRPLSPDVPLRTAPPAEHGRPQAGRVGREAPAGAERREHRRGPAVNSPQSPSRDGGES